MYLGIEIGGTKLQLGVRGGDSLDFIALERFEIDAKRGAQGILAEIERSATILLQRYSISRIGIGFGGPVNSVEGQVIVSHQIDGWEKFPLADWCRSRLGCGAIVGNRIAREAIAHACRVLGWAIVQTVTLLAPEVVVVGGGVSLLGEGLFLEPLRQAVKQYVFPPMADSYEIVPAALGESVVVHGAVALAAVPVTTEA